MPERKTWDEAIKDVSEDRIPKFVLAAKKRAGREGKTIQQVLDEDLARLRNCGYPTANCLDPDDFEEIRLGRDLTAKEVVHLENCEYCPRFVRSYTKKQAP